MEHIDLVKKLTWGLAISSITSCMIRNDYNVMIAFLLLIILLSYVREDPKFFSKIIIHLLTASCIIDVLWLFVVWPYWSSDVKNEYWKSLSGVRSFGLLMAVVELGIKAGITGLFFIDYEKNYEFKDLISLSYSHENEFGLVNSRSNNDLQKSTTDLNRPHANDISTQNNILSPKNNEKEQI